MQKLLCSIFNHQLKKVIQKLNFLSLQIHDKIDPWEWIKYCIGATTSDLYGENECSWIAERTVCSKFARVQNPIADFVLVRVRIQAHLMLKSNFGCEKARLTNIGIPPTKSPFQTRMFAYKLIIEWQSIRISQYFRLTK